MCMSALSKEKITSLIEQQLSRSEYGRFIPVFPYTSSALRHAEHTSFPANRLTCVLEGTLNLHLGSGKSYSLEEITAGQTLVMKPFCLTDTLSNNHCQLLGIVCLSDCLRIFHANSMSNGNLRNSETAFYHISDTYRLCTGSAISTLCMLEDEKTLTEFGPGLMRLIWTLILQDIKASKVNMFSKAHRLWFQIRDFISSQPIENISRRMIAEHFRITETYITILFTRYSGTNFSGYLQKERLRKAVSLLDETTMNISEVAYNSGFDSVSYFIRCFKKQYAISPGTWRQMKK